MSKYSVIDRTGAREEIEITVADYRAAAESGLSLTEHLSKEYDGRLDTKYGTALQQCMRSAGMFTKGGNGIRPPTMKDVFDGSPFDVATVRGDGTNRNDPAGRLLFPEVILHVIRSQLTTDYADFLGGYNSMIAMSAGVTGPRFDQPVIDVQGPRFSGSQPIAQGSEPAVMVNISVADRTYRVPSKAIGLMITDEAQQASTLDLVSLAMTAQARQERVRMVEEQLQGMIHGDADVGETAIAADKVTVYDPSITTAGSITQLGWVKFLRNDYRKRSLGALMMDLDTALAIENRSGKPTIFGDNPNSPRIDSIFTVENLGIPNPRILLLETATIGANTIVGIDTRYAIRRVVNVSASYSAIEQFVMRKATGFRVDYGEMSHKLYPDAWSMMTLTI